MHQLPLQSRAAQAHMACARASKTMLHKNPPSTATNQYAPITRAFRLSRGARASNGRHCSPAVAVRVRQTVLPARAPGCLSSLFPVGFIFGDVFLGRRGRIWFGLWSFLVLDCWFVYWFWSFDSMWFKSFFFLLKFNFPQSWVYSFLFLEMIVLFFFIYMLKHLLNLYKVFFIKKKHLLIPYNNLIWNFIYADINSTIYL